ncbi:Hypothetical protein, putative [Bodo saltans]|uniref:Uncharacterized protein n=1 Tax=Bodo saltans TaxID=75058 RepID=A0A0S4IQQ5_BODSA|nr:Hypothetical protein, putative [Bodo saltans]|eukprot:CUF31840.1 Hypothetical protein, putative [Bodo saltans]
MSDDPTSHASSDDVLHCGPIHKVATFRAGDTLMGCVWGSDASRLWISVWWGATSSGTQHRVAPIDAEATACRGPIHALCVNVVDGDEEQSFLLSVWCSTSGAVWHTRVALDLRSDKTRCSLLDCFRVMCATGERVQALQPINGTLAYAVTAMNRLYDVRQGGGNRIASAVSLGVAFAQVLLPAAGDAPVVCASGTYGGEVVGWCPSITTNDGTTSEERALLLSSTARVLWRVSLHRPGCVIMCLSVVEAIEGNAIHYLVSTGSDDRSTTLAHVRGDDGSSSVVWRESGNTFAKSRVRCVVSQILGQPSAEGECRVLQSVGGEDGAVQAFLVKFSLRPAGAQGAASLLWRALEQYPAHGCSAIALLPFTTLEEGVDGGGVGRVIHGGFDGGVSMNEFPVPCLHSGPAPGTTTPGPLLLCTVPVASAGKIRCLVAHASATDVASFAIAFTEGHHAVVWSTSPSAHRAAGMLSAPLFASTTDAPTKAPCCALVVDVSPQGQLTTVVGYLDGSVWLHFLTDLLTSTPLLHVASLRLHKLPMKIVHVIAVAGGRGVQTPFIGFSDATSPGMWFASTDTHPSGQRELYHVPGNFGAQCTAVAASTVMFEALQPLFLVVGATKKGCLHFATRCGSSSSLLEEHSTSSSTVEFVDCITIEWCNEGEAQLHALITFVSSCGAQRAWLTLKQNASCEFDVDWIDRVSPMTFPWHFSRALFASSGPSGNGCSMITQHGSTVQCHTQSPSSGRWHLGGTWESITAPRLIAADVRTTSTGTAHFLMCHSPDGVRVVLHSSSLYAPPCFSDAPLPMADEQRSTCGVTWVLQEGVSDSPDMNCVAAVGCSEGEAQWAVGGESTTIKVMHRIRRSSNRLGGIVVNELSGGHTSNVLGLATIQPTRSGDVALWLVSVGSMSTICVWGTVAPGQWCLQARERIEGGSTTTGLSVEAVPRFMCVVQASPLLRSVDHRVEVFVGTSAGTLERYLVDTTLGKTGERLSRPSAHRTIIPCEGASPRSIFCVAAVPTNWAPVRVLAGDSHGRISVVFQSEPEAPLQSMVVPTENAAVTSICSLPSKDQRRVACGLDSGVVWLGALSSASFSALIFQSRVVVAATPVRSLLTSPRYGRLIAVADGVMSTLTVVEEEAIPSAIMVVERCDYMPTVRAVAQAALDVTGAVIAVGQGFCRIPMGHN